MSKHHHRRRRMIAIGLALVAIGGTAAMRPVAAHPTVQAITPIEITITGPTTVAPGDVVHFTGTCLQGAGTQEATVTGYLVAGQGPPFQFWYTLPAHPTTGSFTGGIRVPGNAPNGAYHLSVSCGYLDMFYGRDDTPAPFTVDGPQITTTTSTPLRATPHGDPGTAHAPAAVPVRGVATLTG
ncbi:hypothetical protein ACE2AJ_15895 [Aquihabitans daechungensis]|uniref:hypothetical protein n=1 Tax=Aquihabitans daechungensis TaxID=1052257 RepID=UPI003BA1E100